MVGPGVGHQAALAATPGHLDAQKVGRPNRQQRRASYRHPINSVRRGNHFLALRNRSVPTTSIFAPMPWVFGERPISRTATRGAELSFRVNPGRRALANDHDVQVTIVIQVGQADRLGNPLVIEAPLLGLVLEGEIAAVANALVVGAVRELLLQLIEFKIGQLPVTSEGFMRLITSHEESR